MNNNHNETLPFSLYHPEAEGKVQWICDKDAEGNITSVFFFKDGENPSEKECRYLSSYDEALRYKKELEDNGWIYLAPPKVEFTLPNESQPRQLNRTERRKLKRQIKKMKNKQNL